ncbi:MAG: carbohydrate kinase family protein [Candidatus Helarchaeota archaeon]|nr:carbohydrate kinase family protein [Candidatus Helarchaeota archaeon]
MILIPRLKIISVGGVNIDLCAMIHEFPGIDEEIEVTDLEERSGGSAANYIVGVARLGVNAGFIGKIGDDHYGKKLLKDFIRENVDVSQVKIEKNFPSGMCLIPIDRTGNRQIFSFRGANAKLTPAGIDTLTITQASLIHITSPPRDVAEFVARVARKNKVLISYDPGGKVIRKGLTFIEQILQNTDIFLPSRTELAFIFPKIKDPKIAAHKLIENYGIRIVAIKLGAHGCLIVNKNDEIRVNGYKVKVIDTTGAGDAFAAAFTVGIHKKWDLFRCAQVANAAGAITVTRIGARTALPTIQEIEDFLVKIG